MADSQHDSKVLLVRRKKQKVDELKKGKALRLKEIQIYEELITVREKKLKDPKINAVKKIKLEWDLQGLKEDVKRWKETIDKIEKALAEDNASPS